MSLVPHTIVVDVSAAPEEVVAQIIDGLKSD